MAEKRNVHAVEPVQKVTNNSSSQAQPEETERNARVNAVWQQMNKGVSNEKLNSILMKPSSSLNRTVTKTSSEVPSASWMTVLGLGPKRSSLIQQSIPEKRPYVAHNGSNDDAKRLAAAALSAVKDATTLAAMSGRGKVERGETWTSDPFSYRGNADGQWDLKAGMPIAMMGSKTWKAWGSFMYILRLERVFIL